MEETNFKEVSQRILRGLEMAYEKMVKFKKEKGTPLVILEEGLVKFIPSDEIPPTTKYRRD